MLRGTKNIVFNRTSDLSGQQSIPEEMVRVERQSSVLQREAGGQVRALSTVA